jgi:hypothetical protein
MKWPGELTETQRRLTMNKRAPILVILFASIASITLSATSALASTAVPFVGSSENQAISAVPVDPEHVFVTTVGEGQATHLGHFTFVSPHLSGLIDFSINGTQIITAANGDELHTTLSGNLHPVVDGTGHVFLVGDIAGTITGGTGRFSNATGSFTFSIVFDTLTAHSFSEINGTVSYAGD